MNENNKINTSIKLRKLGVNTTSLLEIAMLAMYNPDQMCLVNNDLPPTKVSTLLLAYSKRKKKLHKVMKDLGLYNILYIKKHVDKHVFMGKSATGKLLHTDILKADISSFKKAAAVALLDFVDQMNDVNYEIDPELTEEIKTTQQSITLDGLDGSGLDSEVIASIKDLMTKIKNGEFEGMPELTDTSNDAAIAVVEDIDPNGAVDAEFTEVTE